jgi:DNA-binding GntR family transcriptional regulator
MTTAPEPIERVSAVEALLRILRARILDGELAPGSRLVERELTERFDVARHTLRAALRSLAAEGLVVIEPDRGARVKALAAAELGPLFELRTALEVEASRLALARHGGRLPATIHQAVQHLVAVCAGSPAWSAVTAAHDDVHHAIVTAAGSPRIEAAYDALAAELQVFLIQMRPEWSMPRMAKHHQTLLRDLEASGPDALRTHVADGLQSVLRASR